MDIKSEVLRYKREALPQLLKWYGTLKVTPKECEIVDVSEYGKELGFKKGNFTFQGVLLPTDLDYRGKRTVFDPKPRCIDGEQVYLEYKGFGIDGREMHFNIHRGGDVDFGMFFHYAKSEYCNLLFAAQRQLLVPFPIALGIIPRKEFFKHGIGWLESVIYLCCRSEFDCQPALLAKESVGIEIRRNSQLVIPSLHKEWDLIGSLIEENKKSKIDNQFNRISQIINSELQKGYSKGEDEFIRLLHKFGIEEYINAYESKLDLGFVIRAARSPFRIFTPEWKPTNHSAVNPKEIAYTVGHTFYQLAFCGRFHTYPFPYNWTGAGELTDFEDVTDIAGIHDLDGCLTNYLDRIYSSLDHKYLLKPFFKGGLKKNMKKIDSAMILRNLIFDALK